MCVKFNYNQALICILSSSNGGKTYQRQISGLKAKGKKSTVDQDVSSADM